MVTLRFPRHILSGSLPNSVVELKPKSREILLELPAGQSVMLSLKLLDIKLKQPVIAVINSEASDIEQILEPGDEVRLLPQISGG